MQFSELPLHKHILKALTEERYHTPTKVQEKSIPVVLAKKDVIVVAQTGTGKTAGVKSYKRISTTNRAKFYKI